MGKSIPCTVRFQEFSTRLSSENPNTGPGPRPRPSTRPRPEPAFRNKVFFGRTEETRAEISNQVKLEKMESNSISNSNTGPSPSSCPRPGRVPLAQVVEECVKRWFNDTLKEAKAGDIGMQVLVGQMYSSGYGVPKDEHKGRAWISRASRTRSSAWQVSDKHPGYNASDSDSTDEKE